MRARQGPHFWVFLAKNLGNNFFPGNFEESISSSLMGF